MPPANQFEDSDENWSTSSVEERLELSQKKQTKKRGKISIIACDKCRSMKKKCTGGDFVSKEPCSYCARHGEECKYSNARRRRTANVQDFQQFIDRLVFIEGQLKKLISELREFFESTKNKEEPEFFGDDLEFEIMDLCNKSSYASNDQEILEDPSNSSTLPFNCENYEPEKSDEERQTNELNNFRPKRKNSETKKRNLKKPKTKQNTSPTNQHKNVRGTFSTLYLVPRGRHVTHLFSKDEGIIENTQFQPPSPSINYSDQNQMTTDNDNFCFSNLNLQAVPQISHFSQEHFMCNNIDNFFLNAPTEVLHVRVT
ncbi:28131_t:CDS:2 [Dentiscutata erythropus]|uniref:28131_t:CDS:1 n=1 Tax=Dentiscutata erythropus TaxID=1348616 RepID=A0A9N9F279_9GLOM|nr:28131_t:CDS:2 [Dentiscutata erythropus]